MKKSIKKIICCALVLTMCLSFVACSSKNGKENTTESSTSTTMQTTSEQTTLDTTESTSEKTTEQKSSSTTKKKEKTSKDKSDKTQSITVNKALDILQEFYGKTYEVNATVNEDGFQYFAVFDKKGNKYASVKVNLNTADAVETVVENGATNSYNLLS